MEYLHSASNFGVIIVYRAYCFIYLQQTFGKFMINKFYNNQVSTIGVSCGVSYFYWRMHDFGHVYVDTYAHFFPKIF